MKAKFLTVLTILMLTLGIAHANDGGEWFFKDNVSNDARLVELHMLGAHDAFTAGLNENSDPDAAGIKLGDSGSVAAGSFLWEFGLVAYSRAQEADVETLLNSGVRYFDVRLSRYKDDGEFYTTHGRISDKFTGPDGIARKIAAWAEKHPGEIIVLDFQSLFDIQSDNGGATQQSWTDLMSKLTADGIAKYVHTNNGSINALTYGGLTNNGSRAAIVLFGQVTGSWADSRFINRRDEDGYLRSNWTSQSSYDNMRAKLAEEIAELKNNSDKYFYKLRIMQAQTTGEHLINDANRNNIKILTDPDYDEWSELLPILMVDNAATDSEDFNAKAVDLLAKKNREYTPGVYRAVDGNYALTGSNDNVPLGTKFTAKREGDVLTLGGGITGEMTLIVKSNGKKQRLYKDGELLGETGSDGLLREEITALGEYTLTDTDEVIDFAVTSPLLRYTFTDGLTDVAGNGLDGEAVGSPAIGGGAANLTPGNVIKLPLGLTKHMKEYTVTAWVNLNTPNQNNTRFFDIGRHQRANIFGEAGTDKTSSATKFAETVRAQGGGLTPGKWTHLAAQYSGGKFTLYVDGKKVTETSNNSKNSEPRLIEDYFNNNGSYIGRTMWYAFGENANDNPDMNGRTADFRIYDSALSAEEISRLARTPHKRYVDINTGADIQPAEDLDVPTAYSGVTFPETIGGYELVSFENVTDMAGSSDAVGYYRSTVPAADSLIITREGGRAKATLTLTAPRENGWIILAAYGDGGLKAVKAADVTGTSAAVELEIPEDAKVKAFLWEKGTLRPIMSAE